MDVAVFRIVQCHVPEVLIDVVFAYLTKNLWHANKYGRFVSEQTFKSVWTIWNPFPDAREWNPIHHQLPLSYHLHDPEYCFFTDIDNKEMWILIHYEYCDMRFTITRSQIPEVTRYLVSHRLFKPSLDIDTSAFFLE